MVKARVGMLTLLVLLVAVVGMSLLSAAMGAVSVAPSQAWNAIASTLTGEKLSGTEQLFMSIRLPRIVMSLAAGAALACAGAATQGLFRNPLADPSIIGISSGAALAAAITLLFFNLLLNKFSFASADYLLSITTFIGALVTAIGVYLLARTGGTVATAFLLLAGIAITALAESLIGLMIYVADDVQLRTFTFWRLGSLGSATWSSASMMVVAGLLAIGLLLPIGKALDVNLLGADTASYTGINMQKVTITVVAATALAIGVSVAFCGIIAFIGLVVPHLLRLLVRADHTFLLLGSALGGALLLCAADTAARTLLLPQELPVGILTALLGAPLFLILLLNQKRNLA